MAIVNDSIHQSICAPLSPGESHVVAIDSVTGALVQWGSGSYAWPAVSDPHSFSARTDRNKFVVKKDGTIVYSGPLSAGVSGLENLTNVEAHQYVGCIGDDGFAADYSLVLHKDGTLTTIPSAAEKPGVPDVSAITGVRKISANLNSEKQAILLFDDGTVKVLLNESQTTLTLGPADGLFPKPVVDIATGRNFAHYLFDDGTVDEQVWSNGSVVQDGRDSGAAINAFGKPVIQVSCGGTHACALFSDGTVGCIGTNTVGQLDPPVGLSGVVYVFAAQDYTIAVKDDGTVVHWGENSEGQASVPVDPVKSGLLASAETAPGPSGEIIASVGFSADLTGAYSILGSVDAGLEFAAVFEGAQGSTGEISTGLNFTAYLAGKTIANFGAVAGDLNFATDFSGFHDWQSLLSEGDYQEVYELRLTGAADGLSDLVLKISGWQATSRSGDRSAYLQATVPAAADVIESIENRLSGDLVISKGLRSPDGSVRTEEIVRSSFDTFRFDRGAHRFTATLSGYRSGIQPQNSSRALKGIRSVSLTNGKYRARCQVDLFLQPGMTVEADNVSFVAEYINYFVSETDAFCEVSER